MTMEVRSSILEDYLKSGRGPVYMDCRGIAEEDHEYMMHAFIHEGMTSVINYMKEEGMDLRKNPVEFGTYHINPEGKIWINEKAETSLKGLYAAGDESIVSIGPAATYGWIAGESAALYARTVPEPEIEKVAGPDVLEERRRHPLHNTCEEIPKENCPQEDRNEIKT